MKVKKEIVEAAILQLINQVAQTMPNPTYQFILGGAATFATMKSAQYINDVLKYVSDENGLVDVDQLENIIDGAFKASGGKLQIQLFNNPGIMSLFVKPLTVTINKQDIDAIIGDMKANSVQNEVTFQPKPITTESHKVTQ